MEVLCGRRCRAHWSWHQGSALVLGRCNGCHQQAPAIALDADALQRQITAYETQRNAAGVTINWRFSTHDARTKLQRFLPLPFQR